MRRRGEVQGVGVGEVRDWEEGGSGDEGVMGRKGVERGRDREGKEGGGGGGRRGSRGQTEHSRGRGMVHGSRGVEKMRVAGRSRGGEAHKL